jgi:hypothetical protein
MAYGHDRKNKNSKYDVQFVMDAARPMDGWRKQYTGHNTDGYIAS